MTQTFARSAQHSKLIGAGSLLFIAFLIFEPFKPDLLHAFSSLGAGGWPMFATVRTLLLVSGATLVYFGLARSVDTKLRSVPMPTRGNDPLLTLRAFACILVFLGHGFAVVFVASGMSERLAHGNPIWLIMGSPWAGVWVFFVLSGYLMAKGFYRGKYSLSRSSVWSFYRNRLIRIGPIYCLVLLLTAIFSSPQIFLPANWWQIIALAVFSQQTGAPNQVISALWSIQTEMAFYAAVPLLFMGLERINRILPVWMPIALLLAVGLIYRWAVMAATINLGWLDRIYVPLIGNLDLFLIGMLANWAFPVAERVLRSARTLSFGLAMLAILYLVASFFFARTIFGPDSNFYSWGILVPGPTLVGLATFCVIILFEHHVLNGQPGSAPSRRIVRGTQLVGVLTYALYSWHEPIFLHIRSAEVGDMTTGVAAGWVLLALMLTSVMGYVTFRLIEAPFEKGKTLPPEAQPG